MPHPSHNKRQKEKSRQDRQREKDERRKIRKEEKTTRAPGEAGEDPDLAGIVAGPQPKAEDSFPGEEAEPEEK
jgi:hypothetical protein